MRREAQWWNILWRTRIKGIQRSGDHTDGIVADPDPAAHGPDVGLAERNLAIADGFLDETTKLLDQVGRNVAIGQSLRANAVLGGLGTIQIQFRLLILGTAHIWKSNRQTRRPPQLNPILKSLSTFLNDDPAIRHDEMRSQIQLADDR